eukprot:TRINITY_DN30912_c0_g1_i1.p1 TRINITY_DN30912_c0_g1~~TRINITY_DN30912_c0_g1_i1.p1  ORF type:complete len:256 (+),score=93.44 TRINITY_DN30912_c0_g1_i1:75-842(+)
MPGDCKGLRDFASAGSDTEGKKYENVDAMWKHELSGKSSDGKLEWYSKAVEYWEKQPPTVDGVLGGFGHLSDPDLRESTAFLLPFLTAKEGRTDRTRALDCGAGVGRITQGLLLKLGFAKVDLLEPCAHMLEKAKETLPADRIGEMFCTSIQEIELPANTYDVIVLQWVAIYLTDEDFVKYLRQAKRSLRPGGLIFFKENSLKSGFLVDKEDSSLTRSDEHYRRIIHDAELDVVKFGEQKEFPKDMFKVLMYALR